MVVCDAVMLTAGGAKAFTTMVMLLLLILAGVAQAALLVMLQLTLSPFESVLLKVTLLFPAFVPFTSHWYCGAVPPLTGVAVNVTDAPAQILFCDATMLTAGTSVFTVIITLLLVAFGVVTQVTLLVMTQLTLSPFERALLAKVGLLDPAFMPFTSHW